MVLSQWFNKTTAGSLGIVQPVILLISAKMWDQNWEMGLHNHQEWEKVDFFSQLAMALEGH